jgi:hypothetical protein
MNECVCCCVICLCVLLLCVWAVQEACRRWDETQIILPFGLILYDAFSKA